MRCEHCGSEELGYERDALLVAGAVGLEGDVLVLDAAPRPAPLDQVAVSCRQCGRALRGLAWESWRALSTPPEQESLEADEVLDLISAYVDERSEVQGADFVEFASQLLLRSGREVVDGDG